MPARGWLQRVRHNTYTVCYVRLVADHHLLVVPHSPRPAHLIRTVILHNCCGPGIMKTSRSGAGGAFPSYHFPEPRLRAVSPARQPASWSGVGFPREPSASENRLSCSASAPYLGAPPAWVMSRGTTAFPRWPGTCNTSAGTPKGWQRFLTFATGEGKKSPWGIRLPTTETESQRLTPLWAR